jgi:hypothetical protein
MATIEQIKASTARTVVNGDAVVEAAKKPQVVEFWRQARAYAEKMVRTGRDHSR